MIIKLRPARTGPHIRTAIFMGIDDDHLVLTGTLVMMPDEWVAFCSALAIGAVQGDHRVKIAIDPMADQS